MSRRLLGTLASLALLAVLFAWGSPWLTNAVRIVGLVREAPPRVLPVPVAGVSPGDLTDTWGTARSGGRRHEGIDIFAPRGTPVGSATRGVIVRKGWNSLGGWSVNVLGPGGQHHYYAHLSHFASPEVGDWVDVGEILGFVGDSGNAQGTPPHLHYGLYSWRGEAMNPYPFLVRGALVRPDPRHSHLALFGTYWAPIGHLHLLGTGHRTYWGNRLECPGRGWGPGSTQGDTHEEAGQEAGTGEGDALES